MHNYKDFEKLNITIEKRLMIINEKVNERLDVNFEKTNKNQFEEVISKIYSGNYSEASNLFDEIINSI